MPNLDMLYKLSFFGTHNMYNIDLCKQNDKFWTTPYLQTGLTSVYLLFCISFIYSYLSSGTKVLFNVCNLKLMKGCEVIERQKKMVLLRWIRWTARRKRNAWQSTEDTICVAYTFPVCSAIKYKEESRLCQKNINNFIK